MPRMGRSLVLVLAVLLGGAGARAEEPKQKLQVVLDAYGRIQNIRNADATPEQGKEAATLAPSNADAPNEKTGLAELPDKMPVSGAVSNAKNKKNVNKKTLKAAKNYAPYNGDEYLDSEQFDEFVQSQKDKKFFYIINDGLGQRAEQPQHEMSVPVSAEVRRVKPRAFVSLPDEFVQVDDAAGMQSLLGQALCLPPPDLSSAISEPLVWHEVQLTSRAVRFAGALGALAIYKVGGEGLRPVIVRSYAKNIKQPVFARPYLLLLDDAGCVKRVLSAYFQKKYAATQTQYENLSAEISLHAEEKYLVVVAAKSLTATKPTAYELSQYGQFGIKWKP